MFNYFCIKGCCLLSNITGSKAGNAGFLFIFLTVQRIGIAVFSRVSVFVIEKLTFGNKK